MLVSYIFIYNNLSINLKNNDGDSSRLCAMSYTKAALFFFLIILFSVNSEIGALISPMLLD